MKNDYIFKWKQRDPEKIVPGSENRGGGITHGKGPLSEAAQSVFPERGVGRGADKAANEKKQNAQERLIRACGCDEKRRRNAGGGI
jgi:hypothetical protein